jgi:mannose-6-phosphate isomerase-like protein (cupin superfamily)
MSSEFDTRQYARKIAKPWGSELHWTRDDLPYLGKLLHIKAGKRLSLQVHEDKTESWLLISGQARVLWEDARGELIETELRPGESYTAHSGQRHRLIGVTDADVIEVSTPEVGTTWRLDDDYARPHETPAQREKERRVEA